MLFVASDTELIISPTDEATAWLGAEQCSEDKSHIKQI